MDAAASKRPLGVIEKLLAAGADANKVDNEGRTALARGCRAQGADAKILTLLAAHTKNIGAAHSDGRTCLHDAVAARQNAEVLRALLNTGLLLGINAPVMDEGQTVLLSACCGGQTELVELLLSFDADARACDENSRSALQLAVRSRRSSGRCVDRMVVALLNAGADPGVCDCDGGNALMDACEAGLTGLAAFLLGARSADGSRPAVDPQAVRHSDCACALSLSISMGNEAVAELLLKSDRLSSGFVSSYMPPPLSKSLLELALDKKMKGVEGLLRAKGAL